MSPGLTAIVVGIGALLPLQDAAAPAPRSEKPPILEQQKLRQAMALLASEHAELVSILPVGLSRGTPGGEPRRIEALRLASGDLGEGRPGILVVANIEGPMVYTSGLALDLARRLAADHAAGEDGARALLDHTTVYVIPRANPDAAQARFSSPIQEARGTGTGADDDRDGRSGEDGPSDVDGDGYITWMRIADPEGSWIEDPDDPRLLIEADASRGERGKWLLVREGRDLDGDGVAAEDPQWDAQVDRNFPAGYEDQAPRAGLYATNEPEARALVEFMLTHPDIQVVVVLGEQDNVVAPPDVVDDDARDTLSVPAKGWRQSDADRLALLAERFKESDDHAASAEERDEAGTFPHWTYAHRGLWTMAIRPWAVPLGDEEEGDERSQGARRLSWLDTNGVADAHLGWNSFDHPELGAVEVGGFRPFALIEPPANIWGELVEAQRSLLVDLGPRLARLDLEGVAARDLGGGLLEIRATVVNRGELPLTSTWGERTRTTRPAKVVLRIPADAEVVAGRRQTLVTGLSGGKNREDLVWLVRGTQPEAVGISVESDHAGRAQAQPEVNDQ